MTEAMLRGAGVTPDRTTRLRLDVPELVLTEDLIDVHRFRHDLAPSVTTARSADVGYANSDERVAWANGGAFKRLRSFGHYVYRWSSGATTMMPACFMSVLHGGLPPADFIPSSAPSVKPNLTPEDTGASTGTYAPPGLLSAPSVALPPLAAIGTPPALQVATGDWQTRKDVGVLGWNQATASILAQDIPSRSVYAGIPMDTLMVSRRTFQPDAAFFLRFFIPGAQGEAKGTILTFYFGGRFCLEITGSGLGILWEYSSDGITKRWKVRTSVKYADPFDVSGRTHSVAIFPCLGPNQEKYIHFAMLSGATTKPTPYSLTSHTPPTYGIDEELYISDWNARGGDIDPDPVHVTQEGQVEIQVARPYRVRFNVAPLYFIGDPAFDNQSLLVDSPSGHLGLRTGYKNWLFRISGNSIGSPVSFPLFGSTVSILPGLKVKAATWSYTNQEWNIPGASIEGGLETNQATLGQRHWNTTLAGTTNAPALTMGFFLRGGLNMAGTSLYEMTPVIWGYQLTLPPTETLVAPGEFSVGIGKASFTNSLDITTDRGTVSVDDMNGTSADSEKLRNRSFFHAVLEVDLPAGTPQSPVSGTDTVQLYQGYIEMPSDDWLSRTHVGGWLNGTAGTFPGTEARRYQFNINSMATRAKLRNMRALLTFRNYGVDNLAPRDPVTGAKPPWKVTDALRDALGRLGFTMHQLVIPDLPTRLFPGEGTQQTDLYIEPSTDIIEWCRRVARNYLGGYLLFIPQAPPSVTGTEGAWTLFVPPAESGNDPPVWTFLKSPPGGTNTIAPHLARHYPEGTTFISGHPNERRERPVCNHLWVYTAPFDTSPTSTRYERHFRNHLSYNVLGSSTVSDPTSPHYIGFEVMANYPVPEAYVPNDPVKTLYNLTFIGRRIFQLAMRGKRIVTFPAPLIARVAPPPGTGWNTGSWTQKRIPMAGDRVYYDGSDRWFIKSVTPEWDHDHIQMARYEIFKLEPYGIPA